MKLIDARGKRREDRICLGVVITKENHDKLVEIAEKDDRTLSYITRVAIDEFLARHEAAAAK